MTTAPRSPSRIPIPSTAVPPTAATATAPTSPARPPARASWPIGSTYTGPYDASTIAGHSWKVGPGVAPQATLYMYKVFGCLGATDLTVDAINRAVADGVNVISMSLGAALGFPSPDDPSAVATDNAVKAGVVVVAAAGNSGPNAYVHDSPGAATGAIAAAALDALPTFPAAIVSLGSGDIPAIDMNDATPAVDRQGRRRDGHPRRR